MFDITNAEITSETPRRNTARTNPQYDQLHDLIVDQFVDAKDANGRTLWLRFSGTKHDQNNIRTALQPRLRRSDVRLVTRFDADPDASEPGQGFIQVRGTAIVEAPAPAETTD